MWSDTKRRLTYLFHYIDEGVNLFEDIRLMMFLMLLLQCCAEGAIFDGSTKSALLSSTLRVLIDFSLIRFTIVNSTEIAGLIIGLHL